jgi:hypothetical protein
MATHFRGRPPQIAGVRFSHHQGDALHFSLWDWRGCGGCPQYAQVGKLGKAAVKRTITGERARSWVVDYSAARARAIEWLGERYLLAKPINVKAYAWRKTPGVPTTALRLAPASASSEGELL